MTNAELKTKLDNKQQVNGTLICIGDTAVTEAVGQSGFDVLWIDCEHSPISGTVLQNNLIASRAAGVPAWVRIPWNDPVLAKPVLDMGAEGIIFPYIRSAEDAKKAVEACEYPPKGVRGYGPMRASGYGRIPQMEYVTKTYRNCLRVLQLEHIDAIEDLENIVKVEGVDAFVFGPNDLSGSVGLIGQVKDEKLIKIYEKAAEVLRKANKPFGVATFYDEEWLKMWKKLGATIFFVGCDYGFVQSGASELSNKLKKI